MAAIGGALSILPPVQPPPGTTPQPAYVTEVEQSTQGNVIDMGNYSVTLPSSIPLNYEADGERAEGKEWTVLVYAAGDNDLEHYLMDNIDEMESVGSSEYMDVVVQMDRGVEADAVAEGHGEWTGARRYRLQRDDGEVGITSPVLAELGQVDMADPATLADFVTWGLSSFPAEHYLLVIHDHGLGWHGAIVDYSASGSTLMTPAQMQEALAVVKERTGVKIDVLGFDMCLMASTEVAYRLRGSADYMVASEAVEWADGWSYDGFLGRAAVGVGKRFTDAFKDGERPELTPRIMSYLIVSEAERHQDVIETLSAVELSGMPDVVEAMDSLARALDASGVSMSTFEEVGDNTLWWYANGVVVDTGDLAERILASDAYAGDEVVRDAARGVLDALAKTVVAEQHNEENRDAHGLQVFLTFDDRVFGKYGDEYRATAFARDTHWDELVERAVAETNERDGGT